MSVLKLTVAGKSATFAYGDTGCHFVLPGHTKNVTIPFTHILWAEVVDHTVTVSSLTKKHKNLHLTPFTAVVADDALEEAKTWAAQVMQLAYKNSKPQRKLKVLINPASGQSKGISIWEKLAQPVFDAAHAHYDISLTERRGHAAEIAKALPLEYDAIVTVSGDGLQHEIINGFAEREDARQALQTPIAPIPTGSGNGFSISLLGLEEGLDPAAAALNILKGKKMVLDLCSVTQGDKQYYSFMSQAIGLMADVDLGTEHLRWMGNARFMYGFIRGVAKFKSCPVEISVKFDERDKKKIHEAHRILRTKLASGEHPPPAEEENSGSSLPPLKFIDGPDEGWFTFEKPILYAYAGNMPYVSRDFMQFPVAHPSDGFLDLVVQEKTYRSELLKAIDVAPQGGQYWIDSQHYFKVHAYRAKPLGSGFLSVDGEAYPFEEFQVEAHAGLGTTLSMTGHYAVEF